MDPSITLMGASELVVYGTISTWRRGCNLSFYISRHHHLSAQNHWIKQQKTRAGVCTHAHKPSPMDIQSTPAPLFEKISLKNRANRAVEVFILFLLASLLVYRLAHIKDHGLEWHVALVYELWFTFVWVVVVSTKWSTVRYKTYPQRILQRYINRTRAGFFAWLAFTLNR